MKKQLLSIIALMLCICTVFVLASCSKKNTNEDFNGESLNNGESGTNSLGGENGSGEGGKNDGEFDVEDGLEDVDPVTAEDIFAKMKEAYKATLNYNNGYAITVKWTEEQNDSETGKGGSSINSKTVTNKTFTADPATGKAAEVLTTENYEDNKKTSTSTQQTKIFNQNSKNYVYTTSKADGITEYDDYYALSNYGIATEKEAMLLSSFFGAGSHFAESLGDPFSASSAENLKTVHTAVINEVKNAQKASYEARNITVKQIKADSSIIFNKEENTDTNILKRTITITDEYETDGTTYKSALTIESLLKTKGDKILSFVSTSSRSTVDTTGDTYTYQTDMTSSLSYEFSYALDSASYDSIKTSLPSSGVETYPDYFEIPLTFVINGNEVAINVRNDASESASVAETLEKTITTLFANANIEYDGKWYTNATLSKEFDITSIKTIDDLKNVKKLYNNSFKVTGENALFIDSGKEKVDLSKEYIIVFGGYLSEGTLDATPEVKQYSEENFIHRITYKANNVTDVIIKVNEKELKYNEDPDKSDIKEESAGEFFHEFSYDAGKIYFINRTNVISKNYFTLDSFFVQF